MRTHDLSAWTHVHRFDTGNAAGERGARRVLWITVATMLVEIVAGWWFNSMALQADGWHMSSHAIAIGLSAFAYAAARRYAHDGRFAFGTWKMEVLAGFASAIVLLGVAGLMVWGSIERLYTPQPIQYLEAMSIAALGLVVNLLCATILGHAHHDHGHGGHGHDHGNDHGHGHGHGHGAHDHAHSHDRHHATAGDHQGHDHAVADPHRGHGHADASTAAAKPSAAGADDLNLRSAYVHVLADAATSALAIVALAGGWKYGWAWLDPAVGIFGSVVVVLWARGLIRDTGKVLLDREMDAPVVQEIREAVEVPNDPMQTRVTDLHVWRVGKGAYACALSVVTHDPALTPTQLREKLGVHEEIVHTTIEIERCCVPEPEAVAAL